MLNSLDDMKSLKNLMGRIQEHVPDLPYSDLLQLALKLADSIEGKQVDAEELELLILALLGKQASTSPEIKNDESSQIV